jgi:hypothetical protein
LYRGRSTATLGVTDASCLVQERVASPFGGYVKHASKFTRPEVLILLVIALVILRYAFADTLAAYERRMFSSLGVSDGARVLLLAPIAAGVLYLGYRRGRYSERVPSSLMVLLICITAILAGCIVWWLKA